MPAYDDLKNKQTELIRKALDGSGFIGAIDTPLITTLTEYTPGPPAEIALAELPAGMDDLGWLTGDGMSFSRDVGQSNVTSFGSVSPTRTDVTSDTSTMTVTCQETKLLTIGLATGADLSGIVPDAQTGEVRVRKPTRASSRAYRVLALAVDLGDAGEIYIGRYFPRGKVTSYAEQTLASGDDPITWGVTFTGEEDSTAGYSESWLFGGPGWNAILAQMGFTPTP
jgi:hypothetical protein